MSRIAATFATLRAAAEPGLITYITAGDPDLERSAGIVRALDAAGADVLEIGVPFSDPLADGPVIQRACERALAAGTTLPAVLELVRDVRPAVRAPIVIFSYVNPVLRLGAARFAAQAADAGVDGVLLLDLPVEEADEVRRLLRARALDVIFLVSPTTTRARLERIAAAGSGFLYAVSRLGVTGARTRLATDARDLVTRIRNVSDLPIALGFGIATPEQVREANACADAAVVGSALVEVIAAAGVASDPAARAAQLVRALKARTEVSA
jgi:tryptophan synthase alpha chain